MKFKKLILPFLLVLMLMPFMVNAESCNLDKISIDSIFLDEKSDNVEELEAASVNDKNINLNLSMLEVGDNIKYKIVVKNDSNEDYELDKNSFNVSSDYIDYTLEPNDDSNIVKANSSKIVYLKVEYKNEVPDEAFESGTYIDNKSMIVNLSTENLINTLKNPNTGDSILLVSFFVLLIGGISFIIFRKTKYTKFMILVIGTAIIIPMSVYAICNYKIGIMSNITIKPKPSITDTIYWALQDTDLDEKNDKLVISNSSITGNKEGNFSVDTVFSSVTEVPWIWMRDNDFFSMVLMNQIIIVIMYLMLR